MGRVRSLLPPWTRFKEKRQQMLKNMKDTTGRNRNLIDQFYTKQTVAYECIAFLFDNIDVKENDLLIEPSAGFGAFSDPFLNRPPSSAPKGAR